MMLGVDVNALENKKLNLEIELNNLLNSADKDENRINELKAEILYIKKQINKKLGPKEVEIQEKIKNRKLGIKEKHIKNYNEFKSKYKRISKMEVATNNILKIIDIYLNKDVYSNSSNVKVISR